MDQRADTKWRLTSKDGKVQHLLTPGMIFVGRHECDIVVDSASVDKRHAVIFFDPADRQFHVKDLNSVAGTYLNGTRIPEQTYVKLSHMDCLRFGYGHEVFHVRDAHEGSPPTPGAAPPESTAVRNAADCAFRSERTSSSSPSRCSSPEQQRSPSVPPARGSGDSPCPRSEGDPVPLQEADSLEDLSKTEEESSLGTVREVLPKPPRPPNTLSWKPLPPLPRLRRTPGSRKEEAMQQTPRSAPEDARERAPPMLDGESPFVEAASLPSSSASPAERSPPSVEQCPSAASSTAFTIPFDDDASGRRFGLKDGIKKFAPPKPIVERPTTWLRTSSARSAEVSAGKKGSPSTLGPCVESGDTRRRWSALEGRRESAGGRSVPDDLRDPSEAPSSEECGTEERPMSDSASYLIRRMLSDSPFSSERPPYPPGAGQAPPSPGDDRSETGTYTVGTEKADPAVEEARKKIDEVFGVVPPPRILPSNVDAKLKLGNHVSYQRGCSGDSGNSSHARDASSPTTAGRPKRRLPTPPSERPAPEICDAGSFARRSTAERPPGAARTPPASPRTQRVQARRIAPVTPTSVGTEGRPLVRPPPLPQRSSNATRPPQRRRPWVPSGSEADLAMTAEKCASEETASVVSDTSTEPSSHSSGSQGGPQMKLNRAFALRRARLGLGEVGGTAPVKKRTTSPHCGSNPNLSRQDGGRYSLRLSGGTPGGQRTADGIAGDRAPFFRVKASARMASTSDTERTSPLPRREERTNFYGRAGCISDGEGRSASPAGLGRSASFGAGDGPTPPEMRGPSRTDAFLRGNPSGTFVRGGRDKKSVGVGKGTSARARESGAPVENGNETPSSTGRRELSALDSLVISAIFQLSGKLRANARSLIERERFKYPEDSDARLMIEELLPAERRPGDSPPDGNLTRELSTILKNLKRTEQSLDVLNSLVCSEGNGTSSSKGTTAETTALSKKPSGGFFYVDV